MSALDDARKLAAKLKQGFDRKIAPGLSDALIKAPNLPQINLPRLDVGYKGGDVGAITQLPQRLVYNYFAAPMAEGLLNLPRTTIETVKNVAGYGVKAASGLPYRNQDVLADVASPAINTLTNALGFKSVPAAVSATKGLVKASPGYLQTFSKGFKAAAPYGFGTGFSQGLEQNRGAKNATTQVLDSAISAIPATILSGLFGAGIATSFKAIGQVLNKFTQKTTKPPVAVFNVAMNRWKNPINGRTIENAKVNQMADGSIQMFYTVGSQKGQVRLIKDPTNPNRLVLHPEEMNKLIRDFTPAGKVGLQAKSIRDESGNILPEYQQQPKGVGEISGTATLSSPPQAPVQTKKLQLQPKSQQLQPSKQELKQAEAIAAQPSPSFSAKPLDTVKSQSLATNITDDKYAFNINKNKLSLNQSEKESLDLVIKEVSPELQKAKGKALTNKEVIEAAKKSNILQQVTTREQTLEANAAMLRARQRLVELDKDITEKAVSGDVAAVKTKMAELIDSLRVVSAEAADRGRKLQSLSITAEDESVRATILKEIAKVETDTEKIVREAAGVNWDDANAVAKFYRKFIKPNLTELIDEYRYNNMLSNPRTQLRNAFSNLIQTAVVRPATIAATGDAKGAAQYYQGVIKGLPKAAKAFTDSFTGKAPIGQQDLKNIPTGKLPKFMTIPTRALEGMDKFFSTLIKEGEIARGSTEKAAENAASYSLFRQELHPKGQGRLLGAIDNLTEGVYGLGNKFPAFRWFVPFVRTPMNFAKQWLEYSPTGLATLPGTTNKKEQMAKAVLGSGVTLLGAQLALNGNTTWAAPTDKKEKDLFYASGKKPFSIRVGDKWVSMMYAGPFAFALGLPAAIKHYQDQSKTSLTDDQMEKVGRVVGSMAEFLSGQTFLEGIDNFVSLLKGDSDYSVPKNLGYTAGQMIPLQGLVKYINSAIDPVYRKSSGALQEIQKNIPGLSQQLSAYTTPSGEESRRENINLATPYDVSTAQKKYELPQQARNSKAKYTNLINQTLKEIESGNIPSTKEGRYLTAEHIFQQIENAPKSDRLKVLKSFEDRGIVTPEIVKILGNIKKMDTDYMTKSYRELFLYDDLSRAQAIVDMFANIDKKETKQLRYEMLKKYGLITPEVERLIVQIKQ